MTEPTPWNPKGSQASLNSSGSTLVYGRALCLSAENGDINGDYGAQGYFYLDSRLLSQFELEVNGRRVEGLGSSKQLSFEASFVGRHIDNRKKADHPLTIVRNRSVGDILTETIEIRNYDTTPHGCKISLMVDADFAHLFAVKGGHATDIDGAKASSTSDTITLESPDERDLAIVIDVSPTPDQIEDKQFVWTKDVQPGETLSFEISCKPKISGVVNEQKPADSEDNPVKRHFEWFEQVPRVSSDNTHICNATAQSLTDLESLRIFSPTEPDAPVIAAGAPWFMTLFGRDSLLTAWMSMIVDPNLASGVLKTLAKFQGTKDNPDREEQPGKIMHEVRFADAKTASLEEGDFYYGSADATPLFVMTLGELDRWGEAPEVVEELMPAADAAINWLINYGDLDGDGYIEYDRSFANSLFNQGWKDSGDGIRFANGDIPETPIALCEIQAYAFAAYRARARLAKQQGNEDLWYDLEKRAETLRVNFNRDFWLEDKGYFAVGLDKDKKPIDSMTSNLGHCLWTGIVEIDKARKVAQKLMSDEMYTGWGIRTMSSDTVGYNPTGYHTGSVWPHDTAIAAAGLMRYGFVDESLKVMNSLLDLAAEFDYRLPELLGGFDREEFSNPIPYPTSCSPQAWSAASTLMILRWILRMDPWCPEGRIWLDPVLPEGVTRLRVENIRIAGHQVTVHIQDDQVDVVGLPEHITWKRGLRTIEPREKWSILKPEGYKATSSA